jgi:hypothetical protein
VWNPSDVQITKTTFRIGNATALRWSWFYYGRPKTPENLYYRDYVQQDGGIIFRTMRLCAQLSRVIPFEIG